LNTLCCPLSIRSSRACVYCLLGHADCQRHSGEDRLHGKAAHGETAVRRLGETPRRDSLKANGRAARRQESARLPSKLSRPRAAAHSWRDSRAAAMMANAAFVSGSRRHALPHGRKATRQHGSTRLPHSRTASQPLSRTAAQPRGGCTAARTVHGLWLTARQSRGAGRWLRGVTPAR
jgi:hypothetical protein